MGMMWLWEWGTEWVAVWVKNELGVDYIDIVVLMVVI